MDPTNTMSVFQPNPLLVAELEAAVQSGKKVAEKDFLVLTELLMVQLLKLDGIEAGGDAKVQRRLEVGIRCQFCFFPVKILLCYFLIDGC